VLWKLLRTVFILGIVFNIGNFLWEAWKHSYLLPEFSERLAYIFYSNQDMLSRVLSFNELTFPQWILFQGTDWRVYAFSLLEIIAISWFSLICLQVTLKIRNKQPVALFALIQMSVGKKWLNIVLINLLFIFLYDLIAFSTMIGLDFIGAGLTTNIFFEILILALVSKYFLAFAYVAYEGQNFFTAFIRSFKNVTLVQSSLYALLIVGLVYLLSGLIALLSLIPIFSQSSVVTHVLLLVLIGMMRLLFSVLWAWIIDYFYRRNTVEPDIDLPIEAHLID
jgi:hypothetical protein